MTRKGFFGALLGAVAGIVGSRFLPSPETPQLAAIESPIGHVTIGYLSVEGSETPTISSVTSTGGTTTVSYAGDVPMTYTGAHANLMSALDARGLVQG